MYQFIQLLVYIWLCFFSSVDRGWSHAWVTEDHAQVCHAWIPTTDDGRRTTDDGRRTTTDDDDDGKISKHIFKPCHHIDFNTTNPNPILKITISFTKTPKKQKHSRKKRKNRNILEKFKIQNVQKPKLLFCILYTFHNLYFYIYF